ncbi:MAG: CHAP domain-containing protein [Clostridiales bacterium]|nr:CHAP domain-containing protein [Clostridiales bacterium]
MKRLIAVLLLLCLLPLGAFAAKEPDKLPKKITLTEGRFLLFDQGFRGVWESSDPTVAGAEIDVHEPKYVRIVAFQEGEATLKLTGTKSNKTAEIQVTVLRDETAQDPVPESIQAAIDIALDEWKTLNGEKLPKTIQGNKYVKWWGGDNIGWCGAFASYCLDMAGIPMEKEESAPKLKPLESGEPHSIRAAGVPRLSTAFTNMGRVTRIPRPGYLVIYGSVKDTYGFKHVGLVTQVKDLGDGLYQVYTVEGNMASTVRRYSFLYDARNMEHQNTMEVPEELRDAEEGTDYVPHQDSWYVTEYCMTWY